MGPAVDTGDQLKQETLPAKRLSPLTRNIFILIGIFIVVVPVMSLLLRKKGYK
jgi:hypothetical protein